MAQYTWIGENGDWSDQNDWSPSGLPTGGDLVFLIEGGPAYDITTGTSSAAIIAIQSASVTLEDNGGLSAGLIQLVAGTLTVDSAATLSATVVLAGGTMNVAGTVANSVIELNGGTLNLEDQSTLADDTFDGVLTLSKQDIYVLGTFVANDSTGSNPGVVNLVDAQLTFEDDELLDSMTINLGSAASGAGGYLALDPQGDGGDAVITLTLGDGAVVNSYGQDDYIFVTNGENASSITNYGAIHQSNPNGSLDITLETGTFTNSGLIDSYFGGDITIETQIMRNTGILSIGNGSTLFTKVDDFIANISSRIDIGVGSTWSVQNTNSSTTVRNYGAIVLTQGELMGTAGPVFTNLASGTITGYGTIAQPTLVNQGLIEVSGGGLSVKTTITGAGVFKLDTRTTAVLFDNVTQGTLTDAVGGSIGISSKHSLSVTASATVAGAISGVGTFVIDAGAIATFANGATDTGGGVVNAGVFNLGATTLTAPVKASVISIQNTGLINVTGATSEQALLAMGGAAGFGKAGVLTGSVNLTGDSAISFTSGAFSSIAAGASLVLGASDAYLEDTSALGSNSALNVLATNSGALTLDNGAKIVTSHALTNSATLTLDGSTGYGGSLLTASAGFTNSGQLNIGNAKLSSLSEISTTTFTNNSTVNLQGGANTKAFLSASSVVNNENINLVSGLGEVAGAVSGAGQLVLYDNTSLTLDNTVASSQAALFGADDVLTLKATSFAGQIEDFGDNGSAAIDVLSLAHSGASFNYAPNAQANGGVLTLTSGSHSFQLSFSGQYSNADFNLAADAGTGTLVKFV